MINNKLIRGVALTLAIVAPNLNANLQDEMDGLFSDMSNATPPGVYESQTRGTLSGGRYSVKSKIVDQTIASFTPPSIKSSCGGLDLYGGSFSFINSDQIVQTFRAVAANAKGYAFQMALDISCPLCASITKSFQKSMQAMNQHLGNSCQMAQGLVTDTANALSGQENWKSKTVATANGLKDDFVAAWDSDSTQEENKTADPASYYEEFVGNVTYRALKNSGVVSGFKYGDSDLLEVLMSLTGVVIKGDLVSDANGNKTNPIRTLPAIISIQDLMEGGADIKVWSCETHPQDACLAPTKKTITLTSLAESIRKTIVGDVASGQVGIINKMVTNVGTVTETEKSVLTALPNSSGAMIRQIALRSPSTANTFAEEMTDVLALEIIESWAKETFRAIKLSMESVKDDTYYNDVLTSIDEATINFNKDVSDYQRKTVARADIFNQYNAIVKAMPKRRYTAGSEDK